MTQKTKLPDYSPLFKPRWSGDVGGYTKEQLQAYGAACAAQAREVALGEANVIVKRLWPFSKGVGLRMIEAIEALKGK